MRRDVFLAEATLVRSVEVGHHIFLRKGLEVVDIEATGLQSGTGVRWNQLGVHIGGD